MLERIRSWLTPALLAVVALLLYGLIGAVEDVADSIDETCVPADSPNAQIAGADWPSPSGSSAVSRIAAIVRHGAPVHASARPRS